MGEYGDEEYHGREKPVRGDEGGNEKNGSTGVVLAVDRAMAGSDGVIAFGDAVHSEPVLIARYEAEIG